MGKNGVENIDFLSFLQLKARPDVAGAVLIGICTSLPEMLYRVIGVFVWNTAASIRAWFVGPGVFNILILGAIGGFATRTTIT